MQIILLGNGLESVRGEGCRANVPDFATQLCSSHGQASSLNLLRTIILIFKTGLIVYVINIHIVNTFQVVRKVSGTQSQHSEGHYFLLLQMMLTLMLREKVIWQPFIGFCETIEEFQKKLQIYKSDIVINLSMNKLI